MAISQWIGLDGKEDDSDFSKVLSSPINLNLLTNTLPSKGQLVYEYNPFRNYRVQDNNIFKYRGYLMSYEDLISKYGSELTISGSNITTNIPDQDNPILIEKNELTDFVTDQLKFNLNNPLSITPQYSYDGSVNLILNDGLNIPRLINSRFSNTGLNTYEIIDRRGNSDTNIYDQGDKFDADTSLYKRTIDIPKIRFLGVTYGGNLKIGNYHFYFKYADADGNETDFVGESGLVSIFIGNSPSSVKTGFGNENSRKLIRFYLTNIDTSYPYVNVYYTRTTSEYQQNAVLEAHKIDKKFLVNNARICNISITGFENITDVSISDINIQYNLSKGIKTQATSQNMLFMANVHKPDIPYQDLQDIALRFLPFLKTKDYDVTIDHNYDISSNNKGYYDPSYIYNYTGYWNNELYRLGIVFIMSDNSLSPVFNIRGRDNIKTYEENPNQYTDITLFNNGDRNYINIDEQTNQIITDNNSVSTTSFENAKGVVSLNPTSSNNFQIYGFDIRVNKDVLNYLFNNLSINGFFIVRQKRIPTTLCQAITIGIDKQSYTPLIPVVKDNIKQQINNLGTIKLQTEQQQILDSSEEFCYTSERFIDGNKELQHNFIDHLFIEKSNQVSKEGMICPDYDIDPAYYNQFFTGDKFTIQKSIIQPSNKGFTMLDQTQPRHFYISSYNSNSDTNYYYSNITGIKDGAKLVSTNSKYYSARAGEAEDASKFSYLLRENKNNDAVNIIRGQFGPFLGTSELNQSFNIFDIKVPGYNPGDISDYFDIRYGDKSQYYAISDRINNQILIDDYDFENTNQISISVFRGDCYICQFTHRVLRNFQDPEAPTNDIIVEQETWKDNYSYDNQNSQNNINRGDVNAVQLGMWVTFIIRSSKNLNIRSTDESFTEEVGYNGHGREFFPYHGISTKGSYKTPEALCYNKGFEKSLSERWNEELPDVPYYKNEYSTRIMYSDININDAFKNGFRVFQLSHYKDYPKTYGSIIKLIEINGNLLCVFEHGIAIIPVNERAVAGEGQGGNIYINTSNVLPDNPKIISDIYGSQWGESVLKTTNFVYGVDTVGKKIWRTDGNTFQILSDFTVNKFLIDNISLTERELTPIIGIRNVKTHYNSNKGDVMFTFYDGTYGFEEKVWNLCFKEGLDKFITFYSWVPSYSENIDNMFFSFDRNTSKWISKLGISKSDNSFSDGVTLSNVEIQPSSKLIGKLSLTNRTIPSSNQVNTKIIYSIEQDNFQNYKKFHIVEDSSDNSYLYLDDSVSYNSLCSELYYRTQDGITKLTPPSDISTYITYNYYYDTNGEKVYLDNPLNSDKIVILLNIKATIQVTTNSDDVTIKEYASTYSTKSTYNDGYYESQVAIIPKHNMQFLTTDFWKHGQSGIIDIKDTISPTHWYGKQHPFEFEFVTLGENQGNQKLWENLQIVSNNAEPESFHFEISGDGYEFSKDRPNIYFRQEQTKALYQNLGYDMLYDRNYPKVVDQLLQRIILDVFGNPTTKYDKSTIFPTYFYRRDTINEIEDTYESMTSSSRDYMNLSGTEVIWDRLLNQFNLVINIKNQPISKYGRMRGNSQYKEGKWNIQIPSITFSQKNESQWESTLDGYKIPNIIIPTTLPLQDIPDDFKSDVSNEDIPNTNDVGQISISNWSYRKETKIRDKYLKVKIRYSGKQLAIIQAVITLYNDSFA